MTTTLQTPVPQGDTPDTTRDPWLFKVLCHAGSVATEHFAYDHALRITQALRALRPQEETLTFLQAQLLWSANRVHEAEDLLRGSAHPHARAIQALCAASMGRVDASELAREAQQFDNPYATALAKLLLDTISSDDVQPALEPAP